MGRIYTLAQSGTGLTKKSPAIVNGKGSEIANPDVMKGRAKRKTITQSMARNLVDVAKNKRKPQREKAYWNTYHCQNRVVSADGRLYGNYCKNRFCTLCLCIRKAEIINKYLPVIETWPAPQFVTLTIRSCSARRLQNRIDGMFRAFELIHQKQKKRHQRGKGIQLIGVKSLECNFNPEKRTYNPHFHMIVPDKETADLITAEWLKLWTPKFTTHKAQFTRPVKDTTRDLIEIIKYGSKIFTEPDVNRQLNRQIKQTSKAVIYASALDNILQAMKGHRIFDRFGFNLPKAGRPALEPAKLLSQFERWEFNPQVSDWENTESDEILSGYYPPEELLQMLGFQVDLETE